MRAAALLGMLVLVGVHAACAGPIINRLGDASSAYLRASADSPVAWQPWDAAALRLARALDRPILLSVGAAWCHWCHVMDREAWRDPEIAAMVNGHFVPIKVDRDERPDVDARYQEVARMALGIGGWPLTLFLTPEGKLITGGTTFLADARDGLPGLRPLLPRLTVLYREARGDLERSAAAAHRLLEVPDLSAGGPPTPARVAEQVLAAALAQLDPLHGGFGTEPKHLPASVLGLAMRRYAETGDERLRRAVTLTLDAMAAGALRDHVGGGFFRYTTDRAWRRPHVEKLDYIQAQALTMYLAGYQMTGDARYRAVAEETLGYIGRTLARPRGGFSAHQDADGPAGDATHYLWSAHEARRVLDPAEAELIVRHFGLDAEPRAPAIARPATALARELGVDVSEVEWRLRQAKARLHRARQARGEPAIADTLYADRNGLMISAYLEAYRVLGDEKHLAQALRALAVVAGHLRQSNGGLAHAWAGGRVTAPGLLDDQMAVAAALLDAFEVTADVRHLGVARDLVARAVTRFWDPRAGGFFDAPRDSAEGRWPLKPFADDDRPGGNALAAIVLLRLHAITNEPDYRERAQRTLMAMPASVARLGPLAATYAHAADLYARGMVHVVIVGAASDARSRALTRAAYAAFRPGKVVATYEPSGVAAHAPPPSIAAMLAQSASGAAPQAYVCTVSVCSLPTSDPERLRALLEGFDRKP